MAHSNNIEYAETIALKAVKFILTDDDTLQSFINTTGLSPTDFQMLVKDRDFLGGVLDFLLANEDQLIKFCADNKINPEEPSKIRQLFPGASFD